MQRPFRFALIVSLAIGAMLAAAAQTSAGRVHGVVRRAAGGALAGEDLAAAGCLLAGEGAVEAHHLRLGGGDPGKRQSGAEHRRETSFQSHDCASPRVDKPSGEPRPMSIDHGSHDTGCTGSVRTLE